MKCGNDSCPADIAEQGYGSEGGPDLRLVVTVLSHHCLLSPFLRDCRQVLPAGALSGRGAMTHTLPFIGRGTNGSLGGVLGPAQVLSSKKLFLTLPSLRRPGTPLSFVRSGLSQARSLPMGCHCVLTADSLGQRLALSPLCPQR